MSPGDLVTVAPDPDEVPPEVWPMIDPFYCCAVRLVKLGKQSATIEWARDGKQYDVPALFVGPLRTELFPAKTDRTRAVVYLDQCVVSELIKNSRHELRGRNAAAAEVLATALDQAIFKRETAICLESISHQVESSGLVAGRSGGAERFEQAWEFLAQRSRGLSLQSRDEALTFQIHQLAGLRSGGLVYRSEHLWELGLTRDPDESNACTGILGGTAVIAVPWAELESGPRTAALLEAERRAGKFADFETERRDAVEMLRTEVQVELAHLWRNRLASVDDCNAFRTIVDGSDFDQLPYVDIKTTLVASLLTEPTRKFRDSDLADLEFVALTLPFSHLMMVDGNLCDRIHKHRLDVKYEAKVLPAGLASYEEAAIWLDALRLRGGHDGRAEH